MLLLSTLALAVFAGGGTEEIGEDDLVEISVFSADFSVYPQMLSNYYQGNDVVTKYVEEKFNVEFVDLQGNSDGSDARSKFAMFNATNTIPDIFVSDNLAWAASTGRFADLTPYFNDGSLDNIKNSIDAKYWPQFVTEGKNYILPAPIYDANDAKYAGDILAEGFEGRTFWVREDILELAGYTFTPFEEIDANIISKGNVPSIADLQIQPPIDTPDDLLTLLRKIKQLGLKNEAGLNIVPFNTWRSSIFHIGSMFGFGHWTRGEDGRVEGWLGSKGAKEYFEFLNTMYKEGLIDLDYLSQTEDQLQEKITTGRVAAGQQIPNEIAARAALKQIDEEAVMRPIPIPKKYADLGYYDAYKGAFNEILLNANMPTVKLERILEMYNWLMSDEGLEILAWGPESAGLWEMRDGKKYWKDEVAKDIMEGTPDAKNAEYYGVYQGVGSGTDLGFRSLVAWVSPVYSRGAPQVDWRNNYNVNDYVDPYQLVRRVFTKEYPSGYNTDGNVIYNDGTDVTTQPGSAYWTFAKTTIANLLIAENQTEFDNAWDEIIVPYMEDTNYAEARDAMQEFIDSLN